MTLTRECNEESLIEKTVMGTVTIKTQADGMHSRFLWHVCNDVVIYCTLISYSAKPIITAAENRVGVFNVMAIVVI